MPLTTKRFERKWTDEQIRAVRFDYEGMTNKQVAIITGIPIDTVKSYRRGVRRPGSTGRKRAPGERWRHMKQEELRLFFLHKATLLLGLYMRMQEKLEETGVYIEPEAKELAVQQPELARQRILPLEAIRSREPVAQGPPEPPERPPLLPQDGRRRPRLTGTTGILFTRR